MALKVPFYKKLSKKHQLYFEHRLSCFIDEYEFVGREGFVINDESKVLIGATYIMMTFGMRTYLTNVFSKIVIYPGVFMSRMNKKLHKGEFNPMFKIVVFSWRDFVKGAQIKNDNLHLGIHEFAHVLSIHGEKSSDPSARVFYDMQEQVLDYLTVKNQVERIKASQYIRDYAFTNRFEFIAVLMEYFFETPSEFQKHFPNIYLKMKQMLNYNFREY